LLKENFDPAAIRYLLVGTHYRSPLNFTKQGVEDASEVIKKIDDCFFQCLSLAKAKSLSPQSVTQGKLKELMEKMVEALSDDLNIAESLAYFHEGIKWMNSALADKSLNDVSLLSCLAFFLEADRLYGLGLEDVSPIPDAIWQKVEKRSQMRASAEFKTSAELRSQDDQIRDEVQQAGWRIKDGRPGEPSTVKQKRRTWE